MATSQIALNNESSRCTTAQPPAALSCIPFCRKSTLRSQSEKSSLKKVTSVPKKGRIGIGSSPPSPAVCLVFASWYAAVYFAALIAAAALPFIFHLPPPLSLYYQIISRHTVLRSTAPHPIFMGIIVPLTQIFSAVEIGGVETSKPPGHPRSLAHFRTRMLSTQGVPTRVAAPTMRHVTAILLVLLHVKNWWPRLWHRSQFSRSSLPR